MTVADAILFGLPGDRSWSRLQPPGREVRLAMREFRSALSQIWINFALADRQLGCIDGETIDAPPPVAGELLAFALGQSGFSGGIDCKHQPLRAAHAPPSDTGYGQTRG